MSPCLLRLILLRPTLNTFSDNSPSSLSLPLVPLSPSSLLHTAALFSLSAVWNGVCCPWAPLLSFCSMEHLFSVKPLPAHPLPSPDRHENPKQAAGSSSLHVSLIYSQISLTNAGKFKNCKVFLVLRHMPVRPPRTSLKQQQLLAEESQTTTEQNLFYF